MGIAINCPQIVRLLTPTPNARDASVDTFFKIQPVIKSSQIVVLTFRMVDAINAIVDIMLTLLGYVLIYQPTVYQPVSKANAFPV
jgi:hypothetical protein